ncbi:MAG: MDR family oxidoreductase [Fuerstiella sp.]|jgi:acrylyl-CoA reductase (NADPH)
MSSTSRFRAIRVTAEKDDHHAEMATISLDDLMPGDVVVKVQHSSLNYKDALAVTGRAPVVRRSPLVPGIDLAGTVVETSAPSFAVGDDVVLTGWGVGESHDGGFAEYARVQSEWLVPLPAGMVVATAMSLGTAGFTAMLCVMALEENGLRPDSGDVLVTGATGGVGSIAVALLSGAGYSVTACTGRVEEASLLRESGAAEVIHRSEFAESPRPLARSRWAAAIDVAGSVTLANVLSQMNYGGVVAACGLAHGMDLPTSVAPFILRGVRLIGIDSVMCPAGLRNKVWQRLAAEVSPQTLHRTTSHIPLDDVIPMATDMLDGRTKGRIVVDIGSS